MIVRRKRRLRVAVAILASLALGVLASSSSLLAAETSAIAAPTATFKPARPYWIELTPPQRQALAPLADDWERLDLQTKKKWVEIGNRYPGMNPDEQVRTQQRMREWAMLTPEQRRVARDSFARVRAMNPEQRADTLRKYSELPPEKKQALANEGQAHKLIVVPKANAAPAPEPGARRVEMREGARVGNPALAAQKGASPFVSPSRPVLQPVPRPTDTIPPAGTAGAPVVAPVVP